MSLNAWQTGKLRQVFYPAGIHANGEARYSRCNYDILRWKEPGATVAQEYVVSPTADSFLNGVHINDIALLDEGLSQYYGFYDLMPELVEPHRTVGDGDSVFDLHFFGPV